jgi:hypothetical protein
MRARVASKASITVLPVTWIVSAAIFSRRSASAAVSVGAKCWSAIGATMRRFTSSGQGCQMSPERRPGLDMADGDLAVIGRERADHGGGGVALHDHAVGLLGVHHIAETGQQARGQPVERLARLHHVEVDIGRDARDRQHLIEQPAMLGGDAGANGPAPAGRRARRRPGTA